MTWAFYKFCCDRTQLVHSQTLLCTGLTDSCNAMAEFWLWHVTSPEYVPPHPPSVCWANWRDDSRWCLFGRFQNLHHSLNLSPSEYTITCTNCRWLSLGWQRVTLVWSLSQYRIFSNLIHTLFHSFRGLKNQMRIRIACGLDSQSWTGFWKNDRATVRAVRTIQYNNLLFYLLFIILYNILHNIYNLLFIRLTVITNNWIVIRHPVTMVFIFTIVLP